MMRNNKRRNFLKSVLVLVMLTGFTGNSQNELHTPYPIIFVHGLAGDNMSWTDGIGGVNGASSDIVDFLNSGVTPLKFGGDINISLDYAINPNFLNTKKEDNVHNFNSLLNFGDVYQINFAVNAKYNIPYEAGTNFSELSITVNSLEDKIKVDNFSNFNVGDIIRIGDEFMQVTENILTEITVVRGVLNSNVGIHLSASNIYNLSKQSNQADVSKQGLGVKIAIDAVKSATGASKVILVGHSMGGLAIREYIRTYYPNRKDVAKVVTIGTPHYGSNLAGIYNVFPSVLGIDELSGSIRDLKTGGGLLNLFGDNIFLSGGFEGNSPDRFYSKDINCNGNSTDNLYGLNDMQNYPFPTDLSRTWIVSKFIGNTYIIGPNDGVVLTKSQYPYGAIRDTIMTEKPHISLSNNPGETKDVYSLIRGLDEPSEPELAYKILENNTYKGFITFGTYENPVDIDLFKINISKAGLLKVNVLASSFTGIKAINLMDDNDTVVQHITDINDIISFEITSPGTYFVQVRGIATNDSYKYPYTLTTQFTETQPAILAVSTSSVQYYDLLLNTTKYKTITLTNNGLTNISISSIVLTDTNADQFSVAPLPPLLITPGTSLVETVTFNPTSIGLKNATLTINTNATENPSKIITLEGNGADHETKVLSSTPLTSYIFDNTKVGLDRGKNITIKNTGSSSCTISAVSLEGLNKEAFSITSLPAVPFDLATGESKLITVKFLPTSIGSKNVVLTIANNSENHSPLHTIELYGNGIENVYSGSNNTLTSYVYWYDDQYNAKITTVVNYYGDVILNAQFNTDLLKIGLHSLHIRYKDKNGKWSSVISKFFYKLPVGPRKVTTSEFWFDDDYSSNVSTPITPSNTVSINIALDVNTLSDGLHSYHVRYKDDGGKWSSVISKFFYKLPVGPRNIISYRYWVNDNFVNAVYVNVSNPTQILDMSKDIDLSNIIDGAYSINFQFEDSKSQWSSVLTKNFTLSTLSVIENTFKNNILVYPNPTNGVVFLDLGSFYNKVDVKIFDMNGRIIKETIITSIQKFSFDVNFSSGIYNMVISADEKKAILKIIKY